MKHQKIKCYGHKCPEKDKCLFYSSDHVQGDNEKGDNEVECDIKEYYAAKIRQ